ncbi:hypothetical protein MRB53_041752 [Persea americana]|nr:hypothetical protein MRB53_041752 [Persea americana]
MGLEGQNEHYTSEMGKKQFLQCPKDTWAVRDLTIFNRGKCLRPPEDRLRIEITAREICNDKFSSTIPRLQDEHVFKWPYIFSESVSIDRLDNSLVLTCYLRAKSTLTEQWKVWSLGGDPVERAFRYRCPQGTVATQRPNAPFDGQCEDPSMPSLITESYFLMSRQTASGSSSASAVACKTLFYDRDDPGMVQAYATASKAHHGLTAVYRMGQSVPFRSASLSAYLHGSKVSHVEGDSVHILQLVGVKGMRFSVCADTGEIASDLHLRIFEGAIPGYIP